MENQKSNLSFKKPLIYFGIFVFLISILMGGLMLADRYHKDSVYNRYADEANAYINNNRAALVQLFNLYFPDQESCYSGQNNSDCSSKTSGDTIAHLLPSNLKDWSSTSFIKVASASTILKMGLGGDVSRAYFYPPEKEVLVRKLLYGERFNIPWDHYSGSYESGKVIIPVKDENNKILGAIVRGVIE